MKKNEKSLLKYFFILGINDEERHQILENKDDKIPSYSFPEIISSYSIEGESKLFTSLKHNLTKDKNIDLKNNIFPMKTDYLNDIIEKDLDEEKIKNIKKVYFDYIIKAKKDCAPEHFYHCFQYELDRGTGHDLVLNFGVLIFYENLYQIDIEKNEKNKRNNNDIDIYLGKALVLISDKPTFSLMKKILEKIYFDFIKLKFSFIYLEK